MDAATTTAGSAPSWQIDLERRPAVEDVTWLESKLDAELIHRAGDVRAGEFAVLARRGHRQLIAGLLASVWGGCCEVMTLWVDADVRRQGLATVLLATAEAEAERQSCRQVVLFTHGVEPPSVYLRRGYQVVGLVPDYPESLTAFWLRKRLGAW